MTKRKRKREIGEVVHKKWKTCIDGGEGHYIQCGCGSKRCTAYDRLIVDFDNTLKFQAREVFCNDCGLGLEYHPGSGRKPKVLRMPTAGAGKNNSLSTKAVLHSPNRLEPLTLDGSS